MWSMTEWIRSWAGNTDSDDPTQIYYFNKKVREKHRRRKFENAEMRMEMEVLEKKHVEILQVVQFQAETINELKSQLMMSLPVKNFKEIGRFDIEKLEHMLDE